LPVVDTVAADYLDDVTFLAVAGRAGLDRTASRAAELFSSNLIWGLDDSVWELYGVFGQPFTLLITGDDRVVDQWFGALPEAELRTRIERLVDA
jgi:hypothetical protein